MVHDFQTARLFLSHYGFLSLEALKVRGLASFCSPRSIWTDIKVVNVGVHSCRARLVASVTVVEIEMFHHWPKRCTWT